MLTNPVAAAAFSTPCTVAWATSLAPETAVSATTLACSVVFWATGRQETGNQCYFYCLRFKVNEKKMNLQTREGFRFLLPPFHNFSTVSAVCTAGALPVFTPVTTPSIVLLPGKKERKPSWEMHKSEAESLWGHYSSLALPHRAAPPSAWFFWRFLPLNRESSSPLSPSARSYVCWGCLFTVQHKPAECNTVCVFVPYK